MLVKYSESYFLVLPVQLQKTYSSSMSEPEFLLTDFAKFDRPGQLHVGFQALHAFEKKHSRSPKPWNQVWNDMPFHFYADIDVILI